MRKTRSTQVIFIPGFGLSAQSWDPLIGILQGKPHQNPQLQLKCVELPGHGARSQQTPTSAPDLWTEGLDRLLAAEAVETVIVAFSFGTAVLGQRLAREGTRAISGCLMLGGVPGPETYTAEYRNIAERVTAGDPEADKVLARLYAEQPHAQDHVERSLRQLSPATREAVTMLPAVPTVLLDIPVTVVFGKSDRLVVPPGREVVQDRIPGARYAEIPGAGHAVHLDDPIAVASIFWDFLDSLDSVD